MANTPEERARLWKKGKLNVDRYNRRNDPPGSNKPDEIRTGPRGGRYRINSNGRKSYDVP